MKKNIEEILKIVSVLTDDEKQLLKDTINFGEWGDCEYEFANTDAEVFEFASAYGFCTNDAKDAGHFSGRSISALFRNIYRKLCLWNKNQIGLVISHCHDWWDDGSGDMLFIRESYVDAFKQWASEK